MNTSTDNILDIHYLNIGFHDIDIAYSDNGSGEETIIFVHGLSLSRLSWQKNIQQLKEHYRCIAIDLPGYGESSDSPSYPYSIQFYAEVLLHFIQELELDSVHLAGHSLGGQIAIKAALIEPSLINSLILVAPAGFEVFQPYEKAMFRNTMIFADQFINEEVSLIQSVRDSFYGQIEENAHQYVQQLIDYMHRVGKKRYRKIIEQSIMAMVDEPVYGQLKDIKCPVQIIFGTHDTFIPNRLLHPITTKQLAEKAMKKIPDARLEIIPFSGHFLQWESAAKVNTIIVDFLG